MIFNSSDLSMLGWIMNFRKIKTHLFNNCFRMMSWNWCMILIFQHIKSFKMWSPTRCQMKSLNNLEFCLVDWKLTLMIVNDNVSTSPFVVIENILCKSARHWSMTLSLATARCQCLLLICLVTSYEFYWRFVNHDQLLVFNLLSAMCVKNCLDWIPDLAFWIRINILVVKQDWGWNSCRKWELEWDSKITRV